MIFKIYNCDFGVTINDVNYDFGHVNSLTIEDNERTRLSRGANASDKIGIVYKEGIREAKVWTITVIGLSKELYDLLKSSYASQTRMDCFAIDRTDGSSKIAKNAVLSQEPKQLSLDDSAESMNVALVFESFDTSEDHKS
jgi:hypothetical protein